MEFYKINLYSTILDVWAEDLEEVRRYARWEAYKKGNGVQDLHGYYIQTQPTDKHSEEAPTVHELFFSIYDNSDEETITLYEKWLKEE